MIEVLEQLEQRIESLIHSLAEAHRRNEALGAENQQLKHDLEQAQNENTEGERLKGQIDELEHEVKDMGTKELQIRERLGTILSKIDDIIKEGADDTHESHHD